MKDLINLFEKNNVKYALVGGFAVNYYGYSRLTQDIDLLIFPSKGNALKTIKALEEFGFGKAGIPTEYFEKPGSAIHLGVEPNRIDLLTHLVGVDNQVIFKNAHQIDLEDIKVNIIAYNDLLSAKRSSNRLRDQADADELEKTRKS